MPSSVQLARFGSVEPAHVERMRHEVMATSIPWVAEYGDYQSGGWWTVSLLNDTGDPADAVIRDCSPVPTWLLDQMPYIRSFLDGLGLHLMWARIARLTSNSFLWEHRDYGELESVDRHRLHVPLSTNSSTYLVIDGSQVHLALGHIWRLTPTFAHGAANLYGPDRIHLVLDCYVDTSFERLAANAELLPGDSDPLPTPPARELDTHMSAARQLAELGYRHAAEKHLLRLFFRYSLPPGGAYDMIAELYDLIGDDQAARWWRTTKETMLGVDR